MSDAGSVDLGWEAVKGFIAKLVQAVLGFVGTILFARLLGPVSFGGFYFLLSIVLMINRPVIGFGNAVRKRFSEVGSPKGELFSALVTINLVLIALCAAVLFGTDVLVGRTNVPSTNLVFITLLGSIVFFVPFQKMVTASGYPSRAIWIDTLRSVFTLPLQIGLVLADFGAAGMGYGLAAATVLTIPVTYYSVGVRPSVPSIETYRSLWEFARYSIPGSFVGKAYDRFDILLLGFLLGTGVSGQYEAANKLTIPALFLSGAITSGLMPKISSMDSKSQDPTDDITNAISYASIIAIPIFFGGLVLSKKVVVTAFGSEYAAAAPYLIGLAFYKVISSQTAVYRSALSGLDKPNINLKFSTVALAVNIVLGVTLVLTIGGIGVVVATIVAEAIQYVGTMYVVKSELPGTRVYPITLLEQVGAGALMTLVVYGLAELLILDTLIPVGFVVGFGAAVYGVVLLAVSHELRTTVKGVYRDALSG
jgi:O-antigen/teichoic acid export membrane protein